MEFNPPFSRWLKQRRAQLNLTQGDLARRIHYSPETIRKIEAGRLNPSRLIADRLAEPLEIPDPQREAFIAFASGAEPRRRSYTLPTPATSLVGREKDVAALHKLLRRRGVRLVTLLGPPGVGKTRLGIEATHKASRDFADGACFVALGSVSDPDLVTVALAQALSIVIAGNAHVRLAGIIEHLRDKHLLLVLDNFEQLMEATPAVSSILAAAPQVKILVTSRAVLRISGEHEFIVAPLPAPDAGEDAAERRPALKDLARYPAVALFVQRARSIKPDFALTRENAAHVVELCRRLDGLPLAIELAAARIKLFTPETLLARMGHRLDVLTDSAHDLPARQRTLRDTIDWSYRLLSADEQIFWRRLCVFAGGFTLEAAARVAGHGVLAPAADILQSLMDKSLLQSLELGVQHGEPRFTLLATLHEYALEKLMHSGEEGDLHLRHAAYFADFAESVEPEMNYYKQPAWYAKLDCERDNLRVALQYARKVNNAVLQMRFLAALGPWLMYLPDPQGWAWMQTIFTQPETQQPTLVRAKALLSAGRRLAIGVTDWSTIQAMFEESARISRDLGDAVWCAMALTRLGGVAVYQGDSVRAQSLSEQSVQLYEQIGQPVLAAEALNFLAWTLGIQGQHELCSEVAARGYAAYEQFGDGFGMGHMLLHLAGVARNRGDFETEMTYLDRLVDLWSDFPLHRPSAMMYKGISIYMRGGDAVQAEVILEESVRATRALAGDFSLASALHHLGFVKHLLGRRDGVSLLQEAITLQRRRNSQIMIVYSLERFAWVAIDSHEPYRAARLLGAAQALRDRLNARVWSKSVLHERYLVSLHAESDEADFNAAWTEGYALSLDDAIALALK